LDALYERFIFGKRVCSAATGDIVADLVVVVLDLFKNVVLEDAIGVGDGVRALDKLAGGGGLRSGLLTEGVGSTGEPDEIRGLEFTGGTIILF
jgi:hypothetical protein